MVTKSANFEFLRHHQPELSNLGAFAERYFCDDPNTCLIKLRQFGELVAQITAAQVGLFESGESQADLLRRLKFERVLSPEVADLFHHIRTVGNRAAHEGRGDRAEALTTLKIARQLGIWFHRTFGSDRAFKATPFVPPQKPVDASVELSAELERLRIALDQTRTKAERSQMVDEERAKALLTAEENARKAAEERVLWEQFARQTELENIELAAQLELIQSANQKISVKQTAQIIALSEQAAAEIDLDEDATRGIVDQQLRDRGWQADSQNLRFQKGTRPVKGQNIAIAEYPTADGIADYALFIGVRCIALVEAKRRRKNVSAAIDQAERYAKAVKGETEITGCPWGEFYVPFVFATNGRPYLDQIKTESGIWFRDLRQPTNCSRALTEFYTPEGLEALLEIDRDAAHAKLKTLPFQFGFSLYAHQQKAIEQVEKCLESDRRSMLVAMATGTGKTKLAIALLYRLLSAKRFHRVCFVVDRSALGSQTADEFRTTKVAIAKTFADIFGLQGLKEIAPASETKVHICTIQGLVKRVLYAKEPSDVPPVDQYDLILIDECHRGYLLDREMSDSELSFRSQADYISKYRRVLEHFDAVKIGLTATPALHTREIFGEPIYKYGYRDAVIDGILIDHEPPIQIGTELSQSGIQFRANEAMSVYNTITGEVDLTNAPDDLNFDVDAFNKKVITVPFNRAIALELVTHIDPNLDGKTLIFAATDRHADIVVDELLSAMKEFYGEIEKDAVKKITGSVDRVGDLIRAYRNDTFPKIAVTVDLLTTGIDVPSITNLVFLRRVNSRILYEQMLGRATRRCDAIAKETFRIFDAVDIYANLQDLTEMKPVVVNPKISLAQLLDEFIQVTEARDLAQIRDQILVKLRRKLPKLSDRIRETYEAHTLETPENSLARFRSTPIPEMANWVRSHPQLGQILDWNPDGNSGSLLPISEHPDRVISVTRGYGGGQKPDDFLDSFSAYIRDHINEVAALTVVLQRPRELTRTQLRELRLELDKMGYSDTALRQAWQDAKNEDIAASIIGFIRQAALGDPLISYSDRVQSAMRRILAKRVWTAPQRKWLQRIGEQVTREFIVDREALDQEPFQSDGGFNRLNRIFEGQLESILGDISEELWKSA
jgi:type I restriction enzyme, R subunit